MPKIQSRFNKVKSRRDYLQKTALPAPERKQQTLMMVSEAFGPNAKDQYLATYETAVNLQMVKFNGRVLDPPCLQYNRNQVVRYSRVARLFIVGSVFFDSRKKGVGRTATVVD